jgi:protein SCO1/2
MLIAAIAMAALVIALKPSESMEERNARERREALAEMKLVEFDAVTQDGATFTRDDLEGRWTLLSFGFTHCQLACPPMHANTMQLAAKLANTDVRFVTFSVDPVYDTPERLREYTEQINVPTEQWTFLAADAETRDAVLTGLTLNIIDDTDPANQITLPDGQTVMNNIDHPTRFILIAPDLSVMDLYRGLEGSELDAIASSIRGHLIREG